MQDYRLQDRRARKKANTDSNTVQAPRPHSGCSGLWRPLLLTYLSWHQTSKATSHTCDLGNFPHIEKKSLTRHRISFRLEGLPIGCPPAACRQKRCVEKILRLRCWKVGALRYLPPEPCPALFLSGSDWLKLLLLIAGSLIGDFQLLLCC
jgi:hypothetical protein